MRLLTVIVLMICSQSTYAKIVFYGDNTQTITISSNRPSYLKFPMDVFSFVSGTYFKIKKEGKDKEDYSILSVEPPKKIKEETISFVLANKTRVKVKFKTVKANSPEFSDDFFDFRPISNLAQQNHTNQAVEINSIDLLRSMYNEEKVSGYSIFDLKRTIKDGHKDIITTLQRLYTGRQHNGYVVKIQNKKNTSIFINNERLHVGRPDLGEASSINKAILAPSESTMLYIVAKSHTTHNDIIIPIDLIKEEGNEPKN